MHCHLAGSYLRYSTNDKSHNERTSDILKGMESRRSHRSNDGLPAELLRASALYRRTTQALDALSAFPLRRLLCRVSFRSPGLLPRSQMGGCQDSNNQRHDEER
jgi:hypothetical protein